MEGCARLPYRDSPTSILLHDDDGVDDNDDGNDDSPLCDAITFTCLRRPGKPTTFACYKAASFEMASRARRLLFVLHLECVQQTITP